MPITPIAKPRKISLESLKDRCDRAYQEWGASVYRQCVLCGAVQQVMHHFAHKSHSTNLRWDKKNGVPLCNNCHCRTHQRNDPIDVLRMRTEMERIWGVNWEFYIRTEKIKILKPNRAYLEDKLKELL